MSYVETLAAELARVGIRGSLQRRILDEIADHLESDPAAELGSPTQLADTFADELGTRRALRAALGSFGALALAGLLFAVVFVSVKAGDGGWGGLEASSPLLGKLATALTLLAPQVAFVAGGLAAVRAWRHRHERVMARAQARVIARRATVGVLAGLGAMLGLGLTAIEYGQSLASWWEPLALTASGVGCLALLAALPALGSSWRLAPAATGSAGDVFEDLGGLVPERLCGRSWSFALLTAGVVAVIIAAVGVAQSDGFDGALRGLLDGVACLAGFAVLGRFLALR